MTEKLTIFYSWQSDQPRDTNYRGILTSLKQSILDIEEKSEKFAFEVDEATRDETGSPDIPTTIFNKISAADIFIGDVTTIDKDTVHRKTPNPNVMIELGYAIAELGWSRIILVFNKAFGEFPKDLPFDLEKRRVIAYSISDKKDKSGKGDLASKLTTAIEAIAQKNPLKPRDQKKKTPKEVHREKDIANLKTLLNFVHLPSIDNHIENLPYRVSDRIFFFKDSFDEFYQSTSFHLYDSKTLSMIDTFIKLWRKTLSYYQHFSPSGNSREYHFHLPMDTFVSEEAEKDFYKLVKDRDKFHQAYKSLIKHLREEYIEIDVDEMSKMALQRYVDFSKDLLDTLESKTTANSAQSRQAEGGSIS